MPDPFLWYVLILIGFISFIAHLILRDIRDLRAEVQKALYEDVEIDDVDDELRYLNGEEE